MTVGDNIKKIAEEKDITVYKLAKEANISNGYLSDLVNNKQINPSIEILKRIAKALGVSVDKLIG